eukprot:GILI01001324.1.p1 GENE.GILI01001324.1~~GILI01001324.1.p1  ORF type:complete len:254 (-),score=90.92 GILI01001324.1:45-806(-)
MDNLWGASSRGRASKLKAAQALESKKQTKLKVKGMGGGKHKGKGEDMGEENETQYEKNQEEEEGGQESGAMSNGSEATSGSTVLADEVESVSAGISSLSLQEDQNSTPSSSTPSSSTPSSPSSSIPSEEQWEEAVAETESGVEGEEPQLAEGHSQVEVFKLVLEYLYTQDRGVVQPETSMDLLVAANRFSLQALKQLCENMISSFLTPENAPTLLLFAEQYGAGRLAHDARDVIKRDSQKAELAAKQAALKRF